MTPTETLPTGTPTTAVTPSEATARMPDGTLLRTLRWSAAGEPWALALIVHGLGEHGGRYANVAEALAADAIEVHAYDHRGFGGSAGPRAYIDHWSRLHDDLEQRLIAVRAERPGLPLILYGHSLGGMIAGGYVLSDRPRALPDLLVLSAPAFDADVPAWQRLAASTLIHLVPRMRLSNGPVRDGLSHDPAIREAYVHDPLCQMRSTVRFGHEAFAEQKRVQAAIAAIERMPVPTYVFHGSADPIVPLRASEPIGTKGNVTRHVHDGLRHETHHEPEHAHVLAEVVEWIEEQRRQLATAGAPQDGLAGARV